MRAFIICLLSLLIAGCSATLESTEVAQFNNNTYKITVTEFDEGIYRLTEVSINDDFKMLFKPTSLKDKRCIKVSGGSPLISTCTFFGTYKNIEVKAVKVMKSSLLALSVNYEIYFNDRLVEVVNITNDLAGT